MTLLHKLLTTTLLCFAAVLHANAQFRPETSVLGTSFAINGIVYKNIDGGVVAATALTSDNKLNGIVIIPEEVVYEKTKYKVTQIGTSSKSTGLGNASDITFLSLPGSIKYISPYAFKKCSKLRKVKINEGITQLGFSTFSGCTALDSVSLPSGLKELGYDVFSECTSLRHIKLPKELRTINARAFKNCRGLISVTIPEAVTSIGERAFDGCSGLTSLTIPEGVTSIGERAFDGCTGLTSVTIPNRYIGTSSIPKANLKSLTVYGISPDLSEFIKNSPSLVSVVIEDATSIDNSFFEGCSSLTSVSISGNVTSIGKNAFKRCRSLTSFSIPKSVTAIGEAAFKDCSSLGEAIAIPSNVTEIADETFMGCSNLPSVRLTYNVESIGNHAFDGCRGLTSFTIPESVTSIGDYAFSGCSGLTSFTIPDGVTSIGDCAFERCNSLESISVEEGNKYFSSDGTALYNASKTELISFPCGITEYRIPHTTSSIKSYAFSCCDSLRNIQFDDNTKLLLNKNAFYRCPNLNKVVIGPNVDIEGSPFGNSHIKKLIVTEQKDLSLYDSGNAPYMRALICNENTIDTISAPPIYAYKSIIEGNQDSATFIPYTPFIDSNIVLNSRSISLNLVTNELWNKVSDIPIDSLHPIVEIDKSIIEPNEEGTYIRRYLDTYHPFIIDIGARNNNKQYVSRYALKARTGGYVSLYSSEQTYYTKIIVHLSIDIDPNIEAPQKCGIECDGKFYETEYNDKDQSVTIKDLLPDTCYRFYYKEYRNDQVSFSEYSGQYTASLPMNVGIDDITPTTYTLKGSLQFLEDGLNVVEEGWTFDGSTISEHGNTLLVSGQTPETALADGNVPSYAVIVKNGGKTKLCRKAPSPLGKSFPSLELKTIAEAKATSNTVALICATTNMSDDETNAGFEWRRYDAPELVPSSKANCPIIDGVMTGALRNLSANTYYKFRPFYKSNSGKTWYGEWSAFGTADAYVYFDPTVRTFEVNCDNETTATVRAFVIAGSDEIKEQGFEYWKHSNTESTSTRYVAAAKEDNHQTIISTGQRMTATLENLEPNTTYSVRAYVITEHGTTYGEEQIFSTPAPTAIGNIKLDNTQSGEMTVTINKANAQGVDFVVNGTRNEISAKLYSISGTVLSTTSTTDNGSDARNIKMQTQHLQSGMYLLYVTDGACTKTIRLAIK